MNYYAKCSLVFLSVFLCTHLFSISPYPSGLVRNGYSQEKKNHPEEWMTTHGKEYYSKKEECQACHGDDLSGGGTEYACNMCHVSPKHPDDWLQTHGSKAREDLNQCTSCHGSDLSGGSTGIDCGGCHLNPKHPTDWFGKHGSTYISDYRQCVSCHGSQLLRGRQEESTSPCFKCHSNTQDTARWNPESQTSSVAIDFSNNFEVGQDRFDNKDFETNHYVGVHLSERDNQITFTSQFHFTREWVGEEQNVDLYETYLQFDKLFKNHLSLTLGRQSFVSNIDYFLVDGINFYLRPTKWFDVSLTAGIPRYSEDSDLDGEIGLVTSLSLILNEINYTRARLDFIYQKENFSTNVWNFEDKMYVGASISKGVSIFKFYGLGEYDLTDTLPVTLTVGADIYPFNKQMGFLVEGSYYNESHDDNLESIFTLFSADELWQVKTGIFVNTVKNLKLYQNFSFQRYAASSGTGENGFNAESGGSYLFDKAHLTMDLAYNFIKSYGGTLHGARFSLFENWSRYFFSKLYFEYITYTKVTNDDDSGINVIATSGVKLNQGFRVSAAAEYSNNDTYQHDVRGSVKLDYHFQTRY